MKRLAAKAFTGNGKIASDEIFGRFKGKQTHDTRLVAAMIIHQIPYLLTFNTEDFKRFTEITAIDPRPISMLK